MISSQAVATSVVVAGLSQLGNPTPPAPTGRQSSSVFDEFGEKQAAPRIGGIDDIVSAMDGVFTVSGALRFLILQLVLVNSFIRYSTLRILQMKTFRTPQSSFSGV